jgi:hypothetical protein
MLHIAWHGTDERPNDSCLSSTQHYTVVDEFARKAQDYADNRTLPLNWAISQE